MTVVYCQAMVNARRKSEGVNSDREVCALNEFIGKCNILTETCKGNKGPLDYLGDKHEQKSYSKQ